MIVKESEAGSKICPLMSNRIAPETTQLGNQYLTSFNTMVNCRGASCMAWRETYKDHGFCGMTNIMKGHTTKEYKQIVAMQENENDV